MTSVLFTLRDCAVQVLAAPKRHARSPPLLAASVGLTPNLLTSIMQAAVTEYFRVWNAHDEQGIKALHATASTLTDWDAAHGARSALLWHTRRPSLAASPSPALLPAPSPAPPVSSR